MIQEILMMILIHGSSSAFILQHPNKPTNPSLADKEALIMHPDNNNSKINKNADVDSNIFSYDDFPIVDMLEIGENELALHHLDLDIGELEGLKKRIGNLEDQLRKHADIHIVDDKEIVDSDKILKEMDEKEIKPFEDALKAIRKQIKLSQHQFDNKSVKNIISLVEQAEKFLDAGQEQVESMEMIEEEWEGFEEGQQIRDEIYRGIMKEKFKSGIELNVKLKTKLMEGESVKSKLGHPLRKSGERRIKLNKPPFIVSKYKKYLRKGLSDIDGKFNSSKLMEKMNAHVMTKINRKLDEESENNQNVKFEEDSVVGLMNQDVLKAFDEAADSSRKFIDKTLLHRPQNQTDDNTSDRPRSISRYLAIGLCVLALLVIIPSVFIYFRTSKYGWRTNLDKTKKTGSPCQQVYLQLSDEGAGWSNPFRWKMVENKLK